MDQLSLRDAHSHRQNSRELNSRRGESQAGRLPTPDTARGSFDGGRSYTADSQRKPSMDAAARSPSQVQLPRVETLFHGLGSESRDGQELPPRSPPYDTSDAQRPSLPPLKMMLAANMASPPRTPRLAAARSQPRPQEPMYNVDTYRPPSLYPNKKQRTEILEPVPQLHNPPHIPATPTLSGFGSSSKRTPMTLDVPHIHGPPFPQSRSPMSQREDSKFAPDNALPSRGGEFSSPKHMQWMLQQTPQSTRSERGPAETTLPAITSSSRRLPTDHRPLAADRTESRLQHASSVQSSSPMHSRTPETPYAPTGHHDSFARSGDGGAGAVERAERPTSQHVDYRPGLYQSVQSSEVFVPGSYEYYYPKARKRSNLPKHSTEVMRTWFDQNITNPYPSEDQKAMFASATGISLTQVSNWFINHRRRCPELRDKRAERRKV